MENGNVLDDEEENVLFRGQARGDGHGHGHGRDEDGDARDDDRGEAAA